MLMIFVNAPTATIQVILPAVNSRLTSSWMNAHANCISKATVAQTSSGSANLQTVITFGPGKEKLRKVQQQNLSVIFSPFQLPILAPTLRLSKIQDTLMND